MEFTLVLSYRARDFSTLFLGDCRLPTLENCRGPFKILEELIGHQLEDARWVVLRRVCVGLQLLRFSDDVPLRIKRQETSFKGLQSRHIMVEAFTAA